MLVCALIGLLLLGTGAWALPRPADLARGQEPTSGTVPARSATSADASAAPSASPTAPVASPSEALGLLVPDKGPGTYEEAQVSVDSSTDKGRLYRFDVRVEKGLNLDPDTVARALEKTLDDPRSWRYTGKVRFALVKTGETADLHAYLVTPDTVDKLCAPLLTQGDVSCRAGDKVVLNAKRWAFGAEAFGPSVAEYRQYLANHEFGHALGHGHVGCPHAGDPSPVMLQQTKGLQGCKANPWPSVSKG